MSEASTFVGTRYILGSPGELGKRSGMFTSSSSAGTLTPYSFIMDGIVTLPIPLDGFLVFPAIPATTKAFYLTEEVGQLCEYCGAGASMDAAFWQSSLYYLINSLGAAYQFAISGETESFGSNNLMGQWSSAIGGYSIGLLLHRLISLAGRDSFWHRYDWIQVLCVLCCTLWPGNDLCVSEVLLSNEHPYSAAQLDQSVCGTMRRAMSLGWCGFCSDGSYDVGTEDKFGAKERGPKEGGATCLLLNYFAPLLDAPMPQHALRPLRKRTTIESNNIILCSSSIEDN
ncbi:hypothetical protein PAXRUDRAFT_768147 [Paxillus rubicundulus Ve08.2h10]|uniref:Uncharacterized protein n=1 Tax=Paxillus rubicundulus Ve08.2h10 TaxID=930991 RepID=A0A0D0DT87_9AGAM|nr:hypothetical protein PAXRUDRAFT_768147 [Paxillus rubicundulus Ve08.2h10]